jgi:lysophospholipase L1-like esterase/LysM repeat protein
MKLYNLLKLIILLTLTLKYSAVISQETIEVDSLKYPWYHPNFNYIQFYNKTAFQNYKDALNQVQSNKVTILHLGDSHIQSEIPTGQTRQLLQKKYGSGGRGLIFPYSTAKTYSSVHYSSKHSGNWSYAKTLKLPAQQAIGIIGMSARTEDSTASFTITLNSKLPSDFNEIRIFCDIDSLSYDFIFETDGKPIPIEVFSTNNSDKQGYIKFTVPYVSNTITLKCSKTNKNQKFFQFYGLDIYSSEEKGIIYHSAGVGGAKFKGVLGIDHLNKHLTAIKPDLVILDFGTNDYLYDDSIKPSLQKEIKEIITKVRIASPLSSIILCSTQDLYYHQKNIKSGEKYSLLLQSIAKDLDCAFWDWLWISGGPGSLKTWLNQGLSRTDLIHLTNAGYKIKGKLLYDALENTVAYMNKYPEKNTLLIDPTSYKNVHFIDSNNISANSNLPVYSEKTEDVKIENSSVTEIKPIINTEIKSNNIDSIPKITITQNNGDSTIIRVTESIKQVTDTIIKPIVSNETTTFTTPNQTQLDTASFKINTTNTEITKSDSLDNQFFKEVSKEEEDKLKNKNVIKPTHDITIANPFIKIVSDEVIEADTLEVKKVNPTNTKQKKRLPTNQANLVKDSLIINTPIKKYPPKPKSILYKVRSGDNLSIIADRHNITIDQLKKWNGLKSDNLSIGDKLIIKR